MGVPIDIEAFPTQAGVGGIEQAVYSEANWSKVFTALFGGGGFAINNFAITLGPPIAPTVTVVGGSAIINGYHVKITSPAMFSINQADLVPNGLNLYLVLLRDGYNRVVGAELVTSAPGNDPPADSLHIGLIGWDTGPYFERKHPFLPQMRVRNNVLYFYDNPIILGSNLFLAPSNIVLWTFIPTQKPVELIVPRLGYARVKVTTFLDGTGIGELIVNGRTVVVNSGTNVYTLDVSLPNLHISATPDIEEETIDITKVEICGTYLNELMQPLELT